MALRQGHQQPVAQSPYLSSYQPHQEQHSCTG
uniref:ATP-dependent RNA helicase DDX23 n=1 Tax=Arundo donax TaxID=35708 RepID=A0A0A9GQ90_ARUDO